MHLIANHVGAYEMDIPTQLRSIADRYYLDDDLGVAAQLYDGSEVTLLGMKAISVDDAEELRLVHAIGLAEIPGTISLVPYTELSRQSLDDGDRLPFEGFVFLEGDPNRPDADYTRKAVLTDGVLAYVMLAMDEEDSCEVPRAQFDEPSTPQGPTLVN